MDSEQYDVIVCGTGIKECLLSGLLAQSGKKVLQIDRNAYYGGENPSLNFQQLWSKYKGTQPLPDYYDQKFKQLWNVDLIQKFLLSSGSFVKILEITKAERFIEQKAIDMTLIYQQDGQIFQDNSKLKKYPCTPQEVSQCNLSNEQEKQRLINFYQFVQQLDYLNKNTYKGFINDKLDLPLQDMIFQDFVKSFEFQNNTMEFIGHILGYYNNDTFLNQPALQVLRRIKTYLSSYGVYGENSFIYPVFGSTQICEAIARTMAIYGSTMMLNFEISEFLYNQNGKVSGIQPSDKIQQEMSFGSIQCDFVIADPSYIINTKLSPRLKLVGRTLRCICILNHEIPNTKLNSGIIVIPAKQVGRKTDLHITVLDFSFQICQKGFTICQIQTNAESENSELELQPAFDILGEVLDKFIYITEDYQPVEKYQDNIFITSPLNSQFAFDQDIEQILDIYQIITGQELQN